jgi:hypothetical protein
MRPEKQLTERANPDSFSRTQSTFRFVFFPASPQFARTWESWNPSPHSGEMRLQVLSRVAAVRQNVGELEPKPALWRDAAAGAFPCSRSSSERGRIGTQARTLARCGYDVFWLNLWYGVCDTVSREISARPAWVG